MEDEIKTEEVAAPEVEAPEVAVPEVEVPETSEASEAPASEPYDFGTWDFNDVDALPEEHRNFGRVAAERISKEREELQALVTDWQSKAEHHQRLWNQMLREDDPNKYQEFETRIEQLQTELRNKAKVIDEVAKERDGYKEQFEDHATRSNEQYLTYVERKWEKELEADREQGGDVIQGAIDMVAEMGFDPDEALELGFRHGGLETMAVAAELVHKGLDTETALKTAKDLYKLRPAPEPVPEPEPEPQAAHSPSAAVVEGEAPAPAPENAKPRTRRWTDPTSLDSILGDFAQGAMKTFRR